MCCDNFIYEIIENIKQNKKIILELGSGRTTKLLNLFNVDLLSIEENEEYFNKLNVESECVILPYKMIKYNNMTSRVYDGLENILLNKKFNLVIIDGPLGYDVEISRVDLLHIVKNNITEDCCILVDDYNRLQEKKLIEELKKYIKFDFSIISDDFSKQFIKIYNIKPI
jgi:hypothetical protein